MNNARKSIRRNKLQRLLTSEGKTHETHRYSVVGGSLFLYLIMNDPEQLEQESELYPWLDDSFMACDEMIGLDFFDEANLFDELEEME